jgi:hypothetical protein
VNWGFGHRRSCCALQLGSAAGNSESLARATSLACQPSATTVERTPTCRLSPRSLDRSCRALWQRRNRFDGVDGKAIAWVDALHQRRSWRTSELVLHRYELADPRQLVSQVAKCPVDPVCGCRHEQDSEGRQLAHARRLSSAGTNSCHRVTWTSRQRRRHGATRVTSPVLAPHSHDKHDEDRAKEQCCRNHDAGHRPKPPRAEATGYPLDGRIKRRSVSNETQ